MKVPVSASLRNSKLFIIPVVLCVAVLGFYFAFPEIVSRFFAAYSFGKMPTSNSSAQEPGNQLLCWIATRAENHQTKAIYTKKTWCRRCDKCIFMSSVDDPSFPSINVGVHEDRGHLWEKTKKAFKYIYDTDINNYEWFLKADDDSYFIVENLRHLLSDKDYEKPIYFGARFKMMVKQGYMSGGAGYVLSRRAVELFVTKGIQEKQCSTKVDGDEDVEVGLCMEKLNVTAGDSRDENGRHRFLAERPTFFFSKNDSDWLGAYSYYPVPMGKNCCSPLVISYHSIDGAMMQTLEYLIYDVKIFGHAVK